MFFCLLTTPTHPSPSPSPSRAAFVHCFSFESKAGPRYSLPPLSRRPPTLFSVRINGYTPTFYFPLPNSFFLFPAHFFPLSPCLSHNRPNPSSLSPPLPIFSHRLHSRFFLFEATARIQPHLLFLPVPLPFSFPLSPLPRRLRSFFWFQIKFPRTAYTSFSPFK